jgi:hypothetical protein
MNTYAVVTENGNAREAPRSRGRPRGGSTYKLKQLIANRADAPKSFGDLPEILQLKVFEMARCIPTLGRQMCVRP